MIAWLVSLRPGYVLAAITAIALSLAVVSRNWSCRTAPPPRTMVDGFDVLEAENGITLRVRGTLRIRSLRVCLQDIATPIDGPLAAAAKDNLLRLAGQRVRVETQRRRLFGDDAGDQAAADEPPELGAPIVGVVFGETGVCLNFEQLRAGYARLAPGAKPPSDWKAAETEARKAKRGIWGKNALQPQRHQGHEENVSFVSFVPSWFQLAF